MNPSNAAPLSDAEPLQAQQRWWLFPRPVAWFVLAISLAASTGGWFLAWKHSLLEASKRFDEGVSTITAALTERMQVYEDVLHGAVGLFASSQDVERAEWRSYAQSVSIEKRFPGIDGVGFLAFVPPYRLVEFLQKTRADNATNFTIYTSSTNRDLFVVKYIEPEESHRSMLGRNLALEPEWLAVAERARDSGQAALSGRVVLGDGVRDSATGYVMLLPVYRHDALVDSVPVRRAAIEGWVFARFVTDQLMKGVLGTENQGLHLRVRDTGEAGPEQLVFDTDPELSARRPEREPLFSKTIPMRFGKHLWKLHFTTNPSFEAASRRGSSLWVGAGGGLISLLLFGIAWSLSHTREQALALAADMTRTLRSTNDQLQSEIQEREQVQRRTTLQHAVTRVLAESVTLSQATSGIVRAICKSLDWDVGAVWLVSPITGELHCAEFWHRPGIDVTGFEAETRRRILHEGEGLPGRVMSAKKPAWIPDVTKDQNFPRAPVAEQASLHSAFGFPILLGNELLGVIEFFSRKIAEPDDGLLGMLAVAGSQIGQFIDRKRAEEALRRSEAVYHSLVESLPLSIVRKDMRARLTFANQRFCAAIGRPLDQIVGKTNADLFPPDLASSQESADQTVLQTGQTTEAVEERREPNGTIRFVQAIRTPLCDSAGTMIGLMGIFWDVTDKHRAETELEHERFLLRTLMDNVPERIYFKDRQSRFLRNNRAHLRVFGLKHPEEAIGKSDFDFFSDEHARQAYEDEQRLMASGLPITKEEKETWPDGSTTWALSTKMPMRDERGNTIGTFGISRDITDRKLAEEAMRRAKETAEEANRTKSHFLASMSHELRTPLNSVIGFANILLKNKGGNLGPTELNFLDRIQANGKHLLALINEILDLSKIEARKVELQTKPVDLDVLVRETIAQQEGLVREKPVQLLADLPSQATPIVTDPDKLKQVIINLISNAVKFTEQGTVTVRLVTDPTDHRPTCLQVVDTGIGIPPDKLGVIFEAFQQAEVGAARRYGGTGLGLTISQALCQLMGYRIEVTSEVGRGSTFTIHLGQTREPSPTQSQPQDTSVEPVYAPLATPLSQSKLVLVIDNELDSRTLLTHAIEELGCHAIAAASGEEGLRKARECRPNLITLDLMMPDVDGWQVLRTLKQDPELHDIPVVIVSIIADENRGRIVGAMEVLQKPVSRAKLLGVIQRCLPSTRPRILIIDDDDDFRKLLTAYLQDQPCELRSAAGGGEALDLMESFPPNLVFLDLIMPGMDGLSFLNRVRALPRFRSLAVVIVTARPLTALESEQLQQLVNDVVRKGPGLELDLKRVLHQFLGIPSTAKPAATT